MNKADLFNVEQTVTVHKCFYWLFVHLHIKTFSARSRPIRGGTSDLRGGSGQLPKKNPARQTSKANKSCKSATTKKNASIDQKKSCSPKATKKEILHKKIAHTPPWSSDGAPLNKRNREQKHIAKFPNQSRYINYDPG